MTRHAAHGDAWTEAFVALGSNLGDRLHHLRFAVASLDARARVRVDACSPVYETRAHTRTPGEVQPPYLNAVVRLHTDLAPEVLLACCLRVEQAAGRDRSGHAPWAARTLDLDLLLYGSLQRSGETLVLPHPRLGGRRFVLQPLADLAPERWVPPPFDATVATLLARCPDPDVPVRTDHVLFPFVPEP